MKLSEFIEPDFSCYRNLSDALLAAVIEDGVAPQEYHATSIYPEYFKINGEWKLIEKSRMDCAVVVKDGMPFATEQRKLKKGDMIVLGRKDDGSEGIYVHFNAFGDTESNSDAFSFRGLRTRETSYSRDYDSLYELLEHEKENGFCVWVLGPACTFDYDSRKAMASLIDRGYVDAMFAGNALATHDLEASVFKTALGQDIYSQNQVKGGHYHHLDTINMVRKSGSIKKFIDENKITDGIIAATVRKEIPYVLAGSIRDDGPLPGVISDVYAAQAMMRDILGNATTVIALATQLHAIATGNMTPSYTVLDGLVRRVNFYSVDISEFAVGKLHDRGSLSAKSIVTNVQDFLVNLERALKE